MKLGELKSIEGPLKKIVNSELPVSLAYKISKMIGKVSSELAALEEFRIQLINKYGEKDEVGNVRVPQDKLKDFMEDYNSILHEEVEGLTLVTVPLVALEEAGVRLTPVEVKVLADHGLLSG
jgi:hypothetical protein